MRIRSPGYPSDGLRDCIDIVGKIFHVSRQNPIDRESAAKDIGYSGLTGASAKALANLAHFDLVERTGKSGLRVTDLAVKIIHPRNPEERRDALNEAAYSPDLFKEIQGMWPDGFVSENALRSHLIRNGFASSAVDPAIKSYVQTYSFLQQEGATESHRPSPPTGQNAIEGTADVHLPATVSEPADVVPAAVQQAFVPRSSPHAEQRAEGVRVMEGERVVFVEEGGPAQYLKVIASGEMDATLLEALEDYIKRQKKRLAPGRSESMN
jgi:hypothetical protein